MKFLIFSSILSSLLLFPVIATKEEEQATFNIVKSKDGSTNVAILGDDDPVKVIIKTKNPGGSSMVQSMSLNVDMEIKSKGIMATTVTKKDIAYLEQNPDVESVEVDQALYVLGERDPVGNLRKLAEEEPYGISMVLQDVDFFNNLGTPSGSIKVCVADTGYDLGHVDLPDGDDVTGSDSTTNGEWDSDGHGHGTHCSGTVAAIGDNDEGVVGVIPDNVGGKFQLVIGKALSDSGSGSTSGVMAAIQSCVDNGAKVISLSLGGGGYSSSFDSFVKDLYENEEILMIAAAGNDGDSSKSYPASYSSMISVAAIDSTKSKASFSQYNDQVEISGPGVGVKSTKPDDNYATWSGTSMATSHVAAVAGLLWMHFPECKNYQIRNVLAQTAMDLGDSGCDVEYGYGLVQAKDAYYLLAQGNCGGTLGSQIPVGGCNQIIGAPTSSPTHNCVLDSDCGDDGDGNACTGYTCDNGLCMASLNCADCGKSEVKVEITTDNYGSETTYDIKDDATTVMSGDGYSSSTTYTETECVSDGSYTFTIYDSYGDGMCCSYGSGGYSVQVDGVEVATGGSFSSSESTSFDISFSPGSLTRLPTAPPTSPPTNAPTKAPTNASTKVPTNPPRDCRTKFEPCIKNSDCCKKRCFRGLYCKT